MNRHKSRKRWLRWLAGALLAVAVGLAVTAFWIEPASLKRAVYRLSPAQWPAACVGLRIAVLADLHVGSPYNGLDNLARVVRTTNAAAPDVVLLAGDYVIQGVVGGTFVAPEDAAAVLAGLDARLGTFAVLGNHDWWLDQKRVSQALSSHGIKVLEDASAEVSSNGCVFTLIGVSDYWEGRHDVERAFAGTAPDLPTVVVTHNPDVFPELPRPVDLAIAGHTHGGQVALPWLGRLVVPSNYGERFAAHTIIEQGQIYFVSTGIGTSIIPVRFRVPPEVSVLVLDAPNKVRATP